MKNDHVDLEESPAWYSKVNAAAPWLAMFIGLVIIAALLQGCDTDHWRKVNQQYCWGCK